LPTNQLLESADLHTRDRSTMRAVHEVPEPRTQNLEPGTRNQEPETQTRTSIYFSQ
jgi:hypothetical protein